MRTNQHVKYYIYLRKSSEGEDRQVQSIERQADEVNKLVTYQGLTIAGTFEESRSAMTPNNRPEFLKMVKGIKAGKANGIVCWHINRLARNPLESGILQQLLEDGKIQSIVTKDREYTSADNAIIFSVESSLATQYSKDLGKMVKSGMEKKANMGIFPNRAPLGYLNTKMAEHGSNYIINDPDRFETVKKIWTMMLTGSYVPSQILKIIVNETGLTPRATKKSISGTITISGIYDLLSNPFYAGMFTYNGKIYSGTHEPMVTVEQFEQVQRLLGRKGNPRYQKHEFTYRGIMTCAECGCAITATQKSKLIKSTGLFNRYIYYYCTNRKAGINCQSRVPIRVEELEEQIKNILSGVSISPLFKKLMMFIYQENRTDTLAEDEAILAAQQKRIAGLEKELKNLLSLRITDTISNEEYIHEKQQREKAIIMLKQQLEQNHTNPMKHLEDLESRLESITSIQENYSKTTEEGKRRLLLLLGENHRLIGKKLSIIKHKWLEVIEKYRNDINAEIAWLELKEYVDIKAFSNHFRDMFPLMCAVVEEVGTEIIAENCHE